VVFGAELFVPDIAGWRRERMPVQPRVARVELTPDWVCEVPSSSTQGTDRARKMPTFRRCSQHVSPISAGGSCSIPEA
jgi:hypothetical protein